MNTMDQNRKKQYLPYFLCALLLIAAIYLKDVLKLLDIGWSLIFPFILGGCIVSLSPLYSTCMLLPITCDSLTVILLKTPHLSGVLLLSYIINYRNNSDCFCLVATVNLSYCNNLPCRSRNVCSARYKCRPSCCQRYIIRNALCS